jgi:hypothetical protein
VPHKRTKVHLHAFLTFTTNGAVCPAPQPGYYTPDKRASGTPRTRGRTGLRANVDARQEKNLLSLSGVKPFVVSLLPTRYTNRVILTLLIILILPNGEISRTKLCSCFQSSCNITICKLQANNIDNYFRFHHIHIKQFMKQNI